VGVLASAADVAWLLAALRHAGVETGDALLIAARDRLSETQRPDGSWGTGARCPHHADRDLSRSLTRERCRIDAAARHHRATYSSGSGCEAGTA
jgi:hypothetical protein